MNEEQKKDEDAALMVAIVAAPFLFTGFAWGLVRFPMWLLEVDATQPAARAVLAVAALLGLVFGLVGAWAQVQKERGT